MKRKIIKIDEAKCNGCSMCASACHEGAIGMVNGKAKLLREDYCDGLGDCIGVCPTNAITFDFQEVKLPCGCPTPITVKQWPIQIKLVPINAPYFEQANLLVAADCTAFAYPLFHEQFAKNHVILIGCPKLDSGDYQEKLLEIIKNNNIKSLSIVKMEVPCCNGIERSAVEALRLSGKFIPWQVHTISINGDLL